MNPHCAREKNFMPPDADSPAAWLRFARSDFFVAAVHIAKTVLDWATLEIQNAPQC